MIASKLIKMFRPQLARSLSWLRKKEEQLGPEDDWIEDDRRIIYERADSFLRPLGRPTIRKKGHEDKLFSVDASPNEVERCIHPKYERNLLSSRKYREHHDGGRQWACGSWAYDPSDTDWQHHVYLFPAKGGGTDVYAHKEPSVRLPAQHHLANGVSGDPDNILRDQLRMCGIL